MERLNDDTVNTYKDHKSICILMHDEIVLVALIFIIEFESSRKTPKLGHKHVNGKLIIHLFNYMSIRRKELSFPSF